MGESTYSAACKKCGQRNRSKIFVVLGIDEDQEEIDELWCEECAEQNRYCLCCGHHEQTGNEIGPNSGGLCDHCAEDEYDLKMQDKADSERV